MKYNRIIEYTFHLQFAMKYELKVCCGDSIHLGINEQQNFDSILVTLANIMYSF